MALLCWSWGLQSAMSQTTQRVCVCVCVHQGEDLPIPVTLAHLPDLCFKSVNPLEVHKHTLTLGHHSSYLAIFLLLLPQELLTF